VTYVRCPYPLMIQSFIFSKRDFSVDTALRWLGANAGDVRSTRLYETGQSWRAPQYDTHEFVAGSFRTIRLNSGKSRVQAIVGCPIAALHQRRPHRRR
jgi:hypothetical protein